MPLVRVDAKDFPAAIREHFRRAGEDLRLAALDTAHRGAAEGTTIAKRENVVDRGNYIRGFRVIDGREVELRNDAPHSVYVEHGRRPGAPGPPVEPIRGWVKRKLGITDERVVFAIRRKIHERGIAPRWILYRVTERMKVWFRAEVERRLGGR